MISDFPKNVIRGGFATTTRPKQKPPTQAKVYAIPPGDVDVNTLEAKEVEIITGIFPVTPLFTRRFISFRSFKYMIVLLYFW